MIRTRYEIMAMSAKELRIEIAKLKGYEWHCYMFGLSTQTYVLESKRSESFGVTDMPMPQKATRLDCPDYPYDIAAAWELVEEAYKKEFAISIEAMPVISRRWHIHLGNYNGQDDTLPLAICRAWLLMMENEK